MAALAHVRPRQMDQSFPIDFGDSVVAHSVVVAMGRTPPEWTDPRTATVHSLRVRHDRIVEQRRVVGVLSALWRSVTEAMKTNAQYTPAMKVGTTGPRGCLWAGLPADPDPLFRVSQAGDGVRVQLCRSGLARFSIDEATAQVWVDAAIASTAESRP